MKRCIRTQPFETTLARGQRANDAGRRDFLKAVTLTAAAVAAPLHHALADNGNAPKARWGGISLNYDDSSFYSTHPLHQMNAAGVDAWVDQFAGTEIGRLLFCPSSQRSDVSSDVRQTVWDGFDPRGGINQPFFSSVSDHTQFPGWPSRREAQYRWVYATWLLNKEGVDPYARWIARCRKYGIRPWLSFRMNDVHYVDNPDDPIHSHFWKTHPEYRRDPDDKYNGQALDYGRPEVRAYEMAYVRELAFRYDMDGIELDWMRNPYYFRPGREKEGLGILTDFTAGIRRLLDHREKEVGHRIQLSARVPTTLKTAKGLGFDVSAWTHKRLIDCLVVTPFLFSQFDIPLEDWKELLGRERVRLEAGLMVDVRPFAGGLDVGHSLETARGAAMNMLNRGADAIYLFNFFDDLPRGVTGEAYRESATGKAFHRLMHQIGSITTMAGKSRRHIITNNDTWAPSEKPKLVLPHHISPGSKLRLRMPTGPCPTERQVVQVRLAAGPFESANVGKWKVSVNGLDCQGVGFMTLPSTSKPMYVFEVPRKTVQHGFNVLEVYNPSKETSQLVWVEIAFSASNGEWPTSPIELSQLDPSCSWAG